MLTSLCMCLEQISLVLERIASQGQHEICKTINICFCQVMKDSSVSKTSFA